MTCCSCMARTIIGIVNLVILIIIAICCWVGRNVFTEYKLDNIKDFKNQTIYIIVVFIFVAIVCIIGFFMICCGGFKCFRCTYAFFYLVIVIVEIILVALAVKFSSKAMTYAQKFWDEYKNQTLVQDVELALQCCGFNESYTDGTVCGYNYTADNKTSAPTCYTQVNDLVKKNKKYAMIGGIIILVLQIILFIYATWYGFCYKDEEQDDNEGMTAQA